jgi:hypothetical protein
MTAHIARRRAERTLAGELRRFDLPELDEQLARLDEGGNADAQQFHLAEQWRTKLIEGGAPPRRRFRAGGRRAAAVDRCRTTRARHRPPAGRRPSAVPSHRKRLEGRAGRGGLRTVKLPVALPPDGLRKSLDQALHP